MIARRRLLARAASAALAVALVPVAWAEEPSATPAAGSNGVRPKAQGKRWWRAQISSADNTSYTPSDAEGLGEFELDLATLTLSWKVTWSKLSSPVKSVHLHAPAQPAANGAMMLDLAPKGLVSPATGSAQLTDAQVEYLLIGWAYVLISTAKYPNGEARGQLERKRSAAG